MALLFLRDEDSSGADAIWAVFLNQDKGRWQYLPSKGFDLAHKIPVAMSWQFPKLKYPE